MISKYNHVKKKSFLTHIFLAYPGFSESYRQQKKLANSERDLLLFAFTGSLILFMANLPVQVAKVSNFVDMDVRVHVGLIGFVSLFFLPLFLYLFSGLLYLIFKFFNGSASFFELRLALFWSLNVAGPLIILDGLLGGFFINNVAIDYVGFFLQSLIAWIISCMLTESEQFTSKFPILFVAIFLIFLPPIFIGSIQAGV